MAHQQVSGKGGRTAEKRVAKRARRTLLAIEIPPALRDSASRATHAHGTTVSEVVRQSLYAYVERAENEAPEREGH